jgi:hypothetical protein
VYRGVPKGLFFFGQPVFLPNIRSGPGEAPIDHPGG